MTPTFVITLGDMLGLFMFAICITGLIVWGTWITFKQWRCKHQFEMASIKLIRNQWKTAGYRCKKCGQERVSV